MDDFYVLTHGDGVYVEATRPSYAGGYKFVTPVTTSQLIRASRYKTVEAAYYFMARMFGTFAPIATDSTDLSGEIIARQVFNFNPFPSRKTKILHVSNFLDGYGTLTEITDWKFSYDCMYASKAAAVSIGGWVNALALELTNDKDRGSVWKYLVRVYDGKEPLPEEKIKAATLPFNTLQEVYTGSIGQNILVEDLEVANSVSFSLKQFGTQIIPLSRIADTWRGLGHEHKD